MSLSGELLREMQLVNDDLLRMANGLGSPLRDLVHSQVNSAQPYWRAAVVLCAGYDKPDNSKLQAARVHLATAVEMLYVALSIHRLLMPYDGALLAEDPNKTVLGSTVLAGDYCFSQSAIMAARTGNPEVVAIFAKALQDVSESQLRQIFGLNTLSLQTHTILFQAGASAAAKLRQAPANEEHQLVELSSRLASHLQEQEKSVTLAHKISQTSLAASLKNRWLQVIELT